VIHFVSSWLITSVEALTGCGGQARNILLFQQLYNQTYDVVVPAVVPEGSHGRVLSLEWINGTKLVEPGNADVDPADLPLLSLGIQFTLAQCVRTPWGFFIRRQFDRMCCTPALLRPRCVRTRRRPQGRRRLTFTRSAGPGYWMKGSCTQTHTPG